VPFSSPTKPLRSKSLGLPTWQSITFNMRISPSLELNVFTPKKVEVVGSNPTGIDYATTFFFFFLVVATRAFIGGRT